jgi:gamma-glutamyltranspeptidase/glutathione hydrolase
VSTRTAIAASQTAVLEHLGAIAGFNNAVDAVVAAVLIAAATTPSVLLGPVQLLVGGSGMGLRAVDGRLRQPGRGIARPRGFVASDVIPPAAYFAVPALPAALAATLALASTASTSKVSGPAIDIAKSISPPRTALLQALARRGPSALADDRFAGELVQVGGRIAGGALTAEDIAEVRPSVEECAVSSAETQIGEVRRVASTPWHAWAQSADEAVGGATEIVAAADNRGRVVIACYEAPGGGIEVPELGLVAPRFAIPVLRGTTRVRPGEPCVAPSPIALLEAAGVLEAAVGSSGQGTAALEAVIAAFLRGMPAEAAPGKTGARAIGVVRTKSGARAF